MTPTQYHENPLSAPENLSLATLATSISREHTLASEHAREALTHAIEAGRLLTDAKALVRHGNWLAWLKENIKFSARTTQLYIRLYVNRDRLNAQCVAHLPLRAAQRLMAETRPPEASPKVIEVDFGVLEEAATAANSSEEAIGVLRNIALLKSQLIETEAKATKAARLVIRRERSKTRPAPAPRPSPASIRPMLRAWCADGLCRATDCQMDEIGDVAALMANKFGKWPDRNRWTGWGNGNDWEIPDGHFVERSELEIGGAA
jgi:hypothetical protein